LDKSILHALSDGLRVYETAGYSLAQKYLEESPEVTAKREELTRKKERLEEIAEKLKGSHKSILKQT